MDNIRTGRFNKNVIRLLVIIMLATGIYSFQGVNNLSYAEGDTFETAFEHKIGTEEFGILGPGYGSENISEHIYKFTLTKKKRVNFDLYGKSYGGQTYFTLYNSTGAELDTTFEYSSYGYTNEYKLLKPGTYYMEVFYFSRYFDCSYLLETKFYNDLKNLKASKGKFTKKFKGQKSNYTLKLKKSQKATKLIAIKDDSKSKVKIKVGKGKWKAASKVTVKVNNGKSKKVKFKVTSKNGITRTYNVTVKRA